MNIKISETQQIHDLKKQFHNYFPFLKIEFFNQAHSNSGASSKESMHGNEIPITDLMKFDSPEFTIDFNEDTTVRDFEKTFESKFELHVQVFRKSGRVYLETISTDDWSLSKQNAEGKAHDKLPESRPSADYTDRDKWE
jgi:hypothetical protein